MNPRRLYRSVNDRWIAPLTPERRERAYQETRPIGRASDWRKRMAMPSAVASTSS